MRFCACENRALELNLSGSHFSSFSKTLNSFFTLEEIILFGAIYLILIRVSKSCIQIQEIYGNNIYSLFIFKWYTHH
jgi:hypothetical protein